MRFKVAGATVTIDFLFFFMVTLMLLYNGTATLMVLCLSLLHEAGHIAALLLLGGRIHTLRLSAFGMVMVPQSDALSLQEETLFVLAGPLVNLVITLLLAPFEAECISQIAALSLLLGLFNLLPISALDGGKALWYCLQLYYKESTVAKAVRVISVLTLCLLALFGCYLLWQNHQNFSVLLIVVYLSILLINKPMN